MPVCVCVSGGGGELDLAERALSDGCVLLICLLAPPPCCQLGLPVRVTRKIPDEMSRYGSAYCYDGEPQLCVFRVVGVEGRAGLGWRGTAMGGCCWW